MSRKMLLLTFLALFVSVGPFAEATTPKKWTHIYYVNYDNNNGQEEPATNIEKSLGAAYGDENVNSVVQLDLNSGARRFVLEKGQMRLIQDLGQVNSAAPETFYDFFSWAISQYPGTNVMITVLTPDGNSWPEGSFLEDESANRSMTYGDFTRLMVKANGLLAESRGSTDSKAQIDIISIGVPHYGFWTRPPLGLFDSLIKANTSKFFMTQIASMGTLHGDGLVGIEAMVLRESTNLTVAATARKLVDTITDTLFNPTFFKGFQLITGEVTQEKN